MSLFTRRFVQNFITSQFTRQLSVTHRHFGLLFTDDHEWVKVDNGVALIGISQHAADALGDIVYVELPETGEEVSKGDDIGVIESVKSVGNIISPVSGEITEINEELADDAAVVNRYPFEEGWLVKIVMSDESELEELMDEEKYAEFCAEEAG
ncbi:Oidioi.mRNA.OKI2018_I69.chr2.g4401.t1.cds [Oikopleura dioica]|uniref:Glycine cleavage system H protein n=1 Tax=Oikopleura dioica TaxID=34765 RepID=A0ABN7SX69_OIKDI|nr:Oidioi.mRNA.OKI2018_I69.chr2.g4401.t1.cds [Oikopleura dioica]